MAHIPIDEMVREVAVRFGDRVALEGADRSWTYDELEARVAGLAGRLQQEGLAPGDKVAILSTSSAEVIASILAVLRSGGVFAPLDLEMPAGRLEAVLEALRPPWILVGSEYGEGVGRRLQELALETRMLSPEPGAAPPLRKAAPRDPEGPAYVFFTSGSTGRPKGIVGRLKGIDHFIRWEMELVGAEPGLRVSQLTTPAFDAFLRDAFLPLACGGTACIPEGRETLLDGRRLVAWLRQSRVHVLHCTPSLFRTILAQDLGDQPLPDLRFALTAGEVLLPSDVQRWLEVVGERGTLVNLYGPSETTMTKLFHVVGPDDALARTVPVGGPMPGARALVVDEEQRPCPPGRLGEIFIRTPYRTLGYLDDPERTAEVFIQNPFSDKGGDIVYRTGDLGRINADGVFEFVGRQDGQVKVRGVRLELAPIEDRLSRHPAVGEAVVVDRRDSQGTTFLCAYVVPQQEGAEALEIDPLRAFLLEALPEAMVPSAFVEMKALPRTLSGKVDRRSLPDPGAVGGRLGREYVAPRTPTETILADLFIDLLSLPRVGIHDDFFQLGGHSLLATLLLSRARAELGVDIPLSQLFSTPTVEKLAEAATQLQLGQEDEEEVSELMREIQALSDAALEEGLEAGEVAHGDG